MMKLNYIFTIFIASLFLFSSCLKDDHFGKSQYNTLYNYVLEGQVGTPTIDQNTSIVICNMDSTADITQLALAEYQISKYATISPEIGQVLDYSDTVICTVTAENGIPREYKIVVTGQKENEQVPNSGFQQWYDTGNGYLEPGNDADNIVWSTGNSGAALAGNTPTYPEVIGSNDSIAIMETMKVTIGPRIAAGSLFTGLFELNIINPPASIKPGIPFTGRPSAFKIDMKYSPGSDNQDGDGNPVSNSDAADIYVLLEVKEGDEVTRLATAWYRSSDVYTDWNTIQLDFVYGQLDGSYPDFMKPANGQYADPSASPNQISVIISSSAKGDVFEGAIGSVLQVNDFELIY